MTKTKYTGILAVHKKRPNPLTSQSAQDEWVDHMSAATLALLEQFQLSLDADGKIPWESLALKLAERHVPAFKQRSAGRPAEVDEENWQLFLMMEFARRSTDLSNTAIFSLIEHSTIFSVTSSTLKGRLDRDNNKKFYSASSIFFDNIANTLGHEKFLAVLEDQLMDLEGGVGEKFLSALKEKMG